MLSSIGIFVIATLVAPHFPRKTISALSSAFVGRNDSLICKDPHLINEQKPVNASDRKAAKSNFPDLHSNIAFCPFFISLASI